MATLTQSEINSKVLSKTKKLKMNEISRRMLRDFKKKSHTMEFKQEYIKSLPAEDESMYNYKLETYEVFNVVKRTIETLAAKPFQSDATIDTENEFLKSLKTNFDGYGNSMTRFLMKVFSIGLWDTQAHVFVDNVEKPTATTRPILSVLNNDNILQVNKTNNELSKLRFLETFEQETEDGFDTVDRKRVKIYKKTNGKVFYTIYEENNNGDMIMKIKNQKYFLNYIPLVSFNPMDYDDEFYPESLIFDPMCRVNKQLLQKDCDLNNIVSIICFPLLIAAGFDDDAKKDLKIGPYNMIQIDNAEARLEYVEHTGAAVNTGFKYVEGLVHRMNTLGFEMLTTQTGNITATSKAIDAAGNNSMIANFAVNLTDTAEKIVKVIMDWQNVNKDEYFSIDIKTDFSIKTNAEDMNALISSHQTGAVTNKQFVFELKRRGILDDNFIYDESNENNIENVEFE